MPGWKKGQSGNPRGRPKKARALTALLEKVGAKRLRGMPSNRQLFAEKIWEGLTTGVITFDNGERALELTAGEYIALSRMVLAQIDGVAPSAVDVTSDGERVASIEIVEVIKQYGDDV